MISRINHLWLVCLLLVLAGPRFATAQSNTEVILRVYTPDREASGSWESVVGRMDQAVIHVNAATLPSDTILALAGWEQPDTRLRNYLGNTVLIYAYLDSMPAIAIPPTAPGQEPPRLEVASPSEFRIADALGKPLPAEGTELYFVRIPPGRYADAFHRPIFEDARIIHLGKLNQDADGYPIAPRIITMPMSNLVTGWSFQPSNHYLAGSYLIEHPDYGRVFVDGQHRQSQTSLLQLPLIEKSSPAASRALRGRLVDRSNNPVPVGAVALTRSNLPQMNASEPIVITDKDGNFRIHPVATVESSRETETPISAHTRMQFMAASMTDRKFLPSYFEASNDGELQIVLGTGEGEHRFTPDPDLGLSAETFLNNLDLRYTAPDAAAAIEPLRLPQWRVTDGGMMPFGKYQGTFRDASGTQLDIEEFTIARDTPEDIVLRKSELLRVVPTLQGRVIDGVTSLPVRALVFQEPSVYDNVIEDLTAIDWSRVEHWPSDKPFDAKDTPLADLFSSPYVTLTDDEGRFTLKTHPDRGRSKYLYIAARDRLGVMQTLILPQTGDDPHPVLQLPDLEVFPAGYVTVEVTVPPGYGEKPSMSTYANIDYSTSPEWAHRIHRPGAHELLGTRYVVFNGGLKHEGPNRLTVPAGVNLNIDVRTSLEEELTHYKIPVKIHLAQGEQIDIGRHQMDPVIAYLIRLVDEQGNPLEGIPVRKPFRRFEYKDTDSLGVVCFYATPDSHGKIKLVQEVMIGGEKKPVTDAPPEWEFDLRTAPADEAPMFTYTVPAAWLEAYYALLRSAN